MTTPQNSNGLKAVTGILALFAIAGGVYATVEPMTQKIDMLQTLLEKKEVEIALVRAWMAEHDRVIERRDAEQWERIKSLERATFNKE